MTDTYTSNMDGIPDAWDVANATLSELVDTVNELETVARAKLAEIVALPAEQYRRHDSGTAVYECLAGSIRALAETYAQLAGDESYTGPDLPPEPVF